MLAARLPRQLRYRCRKCRLDGATHAARSGTGCRASDEAKPTAGLLMQTVGASGDGQIMVARVASKARVPGGRGLRRGGLAADPDCDASLPVLPYSRLVRALVGAAGAGGIRSEERRVG